MYLGNARTNVNFLMTADQDLPQGSEVEAHIIAMQEIEINGTKEELLDYILLFKKRANLLSIREKI